MVGADLSNPPKPMVVDLDGTLFKGDLTWEALFQVLSRNPLVFLRSLLAGFAGKAAFKTSLAPHFLAEWDSLPLNREVVNLIEQSREEGRSVVLATGSHELLAKRFAQESGLFDEVHGSTRHTNLTGRAKADFLAGRYGSKGFHYVGNGWVDLPVFQVADRAVLVRGSRRLHATATKVNPNVESIATTTAVNRLVVWLEALRPHQWLKNLLLLVAPLTALFFSPESAANLAVTFILLSLASSATYLLNDVLDISADRLIPQKKKRAVASGEIASSAAFGLSGLILALVLGLAFWLLGQGIALMLCGYAVASISYSLVLKKFAILDVVWLAGLYTFRIVLGAIVAGLGVSIWLLSFSVLTFFSLALLKRAIEIRERVFSSSETLPGRGYRQTDEQMLVSAGVSGGIVSVLLLALYSQTLVEERQLTDSGGLFLWVPIWLFWISRMWLKGLRGEVDHDPVFFAIRDPLSWFLGLVVIVSVLAIQ